MSHITSYMRYFAVGAMVGVFSIALRELLGLLLQAESAFLYGVSVALAYTIAILASYLGHRFYTFRHATPINGTTGSLIRFTIIALLGLAGTTGMSVMLRTSVFTDDLFGRLADSLAFGAGGLSVSVISYLLNATFTFSKVGHDSEK